MWNKICLALVFVLILSVSLFGCEKNITSNQNYSNSKIDITNSLTEAVTHQNGDKRYLDEIELSNIIQKKNKKIYQIGDVFEDSIITGIQYEQIFRENIWEDNSIEIEFKSENPIHVSVLIVNGEIVETYINKFYLYQMPLVFHEDINNLNQNSKIELDNDYLKKSILEFSKNEINVPNDIFEIEGEINLPIVVSIEKFVLDIDNSYNYKYILYPTNIEIEENIENIDFTKLENDDIPWETICTRSLQTIDLSDPQSSSELHTVKINDNISGVNIVDITHEEFFINNEWYDGLCSAVMEGDFNLTGKLIVGDIPHTIFEFNDNNQSSVPMIYVHKPKSPHTFDFVAIDSQALTDLVLDYNGTLSSLEYYEAVELNNANIVFRTVTDTYGFNFTPPPSGVVSTVIDNNTGEVIYTAPAEAQHVE